MSIDKNIVMIVICLLWQNATWTCLKYKSQLQSRTDQTGVLEKLMWRLGWRKEQSARRARDGKPNPGCQDDAPSWGSRACNIASWNAAFSPWLSLSSPVPSTLGFLLLKRAALPLMRSIKSLWKRWVMVTDSSSPLLVRCFNWTLLPFASSLELPVLQIWLRTDDGLVWPKDLWEPVTLQRGAAGWKLGCRPALNPEELPPLQCAWQRIFQASWSQRWRYVPCGSIGWEPGGLRGAQREEKRREENCRLNQGISMNDIHPCWYKGDVSLGEDMVYPRGAQQ